MGCLSQGKWGLPFADRGMQSLTQSCLPLAFPRAGAGGVQRGEAAVRGEVQDVVLDFVRMFHSELPKYNLPTQA